MGNKVTQNQNSNEKEIDIKNSNFQEINGVLKLQLFLRRAKANRIKQKKLNERRDEIISKIEKFETKFNIESKKSIRERVGNNINDLIIRDDNSSLFNNHFETILKLNSKSLLVKLDLPISFTDCSFINNNCAYDNQSKFKDLKTKKYIYQGQISLNLIETTTGINGFGWIILPSDIVVKGIFVKGVIQSPAKIYYKTGEIYEGKFFNIRRSISSNLSNK